MVTPSYEDIVQKNILDLLNLHDVPEEKKQALYEQLYKTVENRAVLRLDALLSDEDAQQWAELLQSGDRQAADSFLAGRSIDIEQILLEEAALLKGELVFLLEESPSQENQAEA